MVKEMEAREGVGCGDDGMYDKREKRHGSPGPAGDGVDLLHRTCIGNRNGDSEEWRRRHAIIEFFLTGE